MKDKSLKKHLPYMLLCSASFGLINGLFILKTNQVAELIGAITFAILAYSGLSLLIVRIVKWLRKDSRCDNKATIQVWIIQLILIVLVGYGSFCI